MQSVETQQNRPSKLTGLEFEWAFNQESISCVSEQDTDENKDFIFTGFAVSLFFVSSLIKGVVGGFIYRQAPAAGRCRLNVLLMEQIMSKIGFFRALTEDERERREG